MSATYEAKDILKEILNILSLICGKSKKALYFNLGEEKKSEIRKKFPKINFVIQKTISNVLMIQMNYTYILYGKFIL